MPVALILMLMVAFALEIRLWFDFDLASTPAVALIKIAAHLLSALHSHDSIQPVNITKIVSVSLGTKIVWKLLFSVVVERLRRCSNLRLCKNAYFHTIC